jgi:large subunit ribosomal protein L25
VPDSIDADVTELEVGDSVKVGDLVAPSGVTILLAEDETVLAVVPPQAREVEEAAEELEGEEAEVAEGEEAEAGAEAPSAEEGGEGE